MGQRETEGPAGRYAVYGEIGAKGPVAVHFGRLSGPEGRARAVAIRKIARSAEAGAPATEEARLPAAFRHANVVPTLDVVSRDDAVLLVMEYVEGESLSRLLRACTAERSAVPLAVASAVAVGMLNGLHAAHEAKNEFGEPLAIVHHAMSPQSVLVGADGVARVTGFGAGKVLRRMRGGEGSGLDGAAGYASPEQVRGVPATRRTDVFAASVILWEALSMQRLFAAEDDAAALQKVLTMKVPPPSSVSPAVPPELDAVVLRGLEKDEKRRWGTAREMALALEQAAPPAMPSEVKAWVQEVAGEALAKRAQARREIESGAERPREAAPGIIGSSQFIADYLWPELAAKAAGEGARGEPAATPAWEEEIVHAPAAKPSAPDFAGERSPRPRSVAPTASSPSRDERPAPAASRGPVLDVVRPPRPSLPPLPVARRAWPRKAIRTGVAAVTGVLGLAAVASVFVPRYVRDLAVEAAAEQGITLGIADVSFGIGTVRLVGVSVTCPEVPGVKATAADVTVAMSGWQPMVATASGVDVAIDGSLVDVSLAIERMRAAHAGRAARGAAGEGKPRVVAPAVHVVWTRPFGQGSRIEIEGGALDMSPRASARVGDEVHFTTQRLTLSTAIGTLGPWRLDVDRDPTTARARVAFDPPVPDGPNLLYSRGAAGEAHLDVSIPRSPLFQLGVPADAAAHVPGAPAQLEAQVHYAKLPARTEASATITLVGARVPPAPGPVDVTIAGNLAGDGRGPLDLQGGTLSAGPLQAALTGIVAIGDDVRADLTWRAAPIACAKLVPASMSKGLADLAKELGDAGDIQQELTNMGLDLAGLGGGLAPHVSGTLSASGTLAFDTADPSKATFTVKTKNGCGLSLLVGR